MLWFESDYIEGAHPKILEELTRTNFEKLSGYGSDVYCDQAKALIREACGDAEADVFFLVGGTQTNATVIASLLRDYEGAVSAATGHIGVHEAGAVEYTGHKVLSLPEHAGKIDPAELESYLKAFYGDANHEHMVFPGLVYISQPTEYGTLYTKEELRKIAAIAHRHGLKLYLDGARLGYGIAADPEVSLKALAECCDAFYIGGTKVGALCGEAVVFPRHGAPAHFLTLTKQHGAMLAKGRLLGIQFKALFTDGLYLEISAHAIKMADKLRKALKEKGYRLFVDSPTNQLFVVLTDAKKAELEKEVRFSTWEKVDDTHTAIRLVTSWATEESAVDGLIKLL